MSVLFSVFVLNDIIIKRIRKTKAPIKQSIRVLFLERNNDADTWKFIILWQNGINSKQHEWQKRAMNISQSFFLFFVSNVMLKLHMLFGELPTISCDLAVVKEVLLLYTADL